MVLDLGASGYCKVTKTIYVNCANSYLCDSDPTHSTSASYQMPRVHVAYTDPCLCSSTQGWYFGIKPVSATPNCEPYIFKVHYTDPCNVTHCDEIDEGAIECICIKNNTQVVIRAQSNHCCLPSSRYWYYAFTPSGTIEPAEPWNNPDCVYWCAPSPSCNSNDDLYNFTLTTPTGGDPISCLTGDNKEKNSLRVKNRPPYSNGYSPFEPTINQTGSISLNINTSGGFLSIYSINGIRVIFNQPVSSNNLDAIEFNSAFKFFPGLYIVEFRDNNNTRLIGKVYLY